MVRFIRYNKIFRFYEIIQPYLQYSPPVEKELPGKKVLILAPHPDDEAIGCGGAILLNSKNKGDTTVVFLTSDNQTRIKEAQLSCKILKVSKTILLGNKSNTLSSSKELPKILMNIFEEKKPEIVFLPFWLDNHADHRAVNSALLKISKMKKFDFMIYSYCVWLPIYPNVFIDISSTWDQKKKAINCYASQLQSRDYVTMSYSLGKYWATIKGRNIEVAEPYFRATFKEYVQLGKKLNLKI